MKEKHIKNIENNNDMTSVLMTSKYTKFKQDIIEVPELIPFFKDLRDDSDLDKTIVKLLR